MRITCSVDRQRTVNLYISTQADLEMMPKKMGVGEAWARSSKDGAEMYVLNPDVKHTMYLAGKATDGSGGYLLHTKPTGGDCGLQFGFWVTSKRYNLLPTFVSLHAPSTMMGCPVIEDGGKVVGKVTDIAILP